MKAWKKDRTAISCALVRKARFEKKKCTEACIMGRKQLLQFYKQQLEKNFLPYWFRYVDYEHGWILNCINNIGDQRFGDDQEQLILDT